MSRQYLSSYLSCGITILAIHTTLWYQAYIIKNRDVTAGLIRRAKAVGCQGIFLTVDSVRLGYPEADARNGFNALPAPHRLVNYDKYNSNLDETYNSKKEKSWDQNIDRMWEQNLSWADVTWLKQEFCQDMPLIIKGIMTAEDAILAVQAGADAIMVSNHGGRQLDGCLSALDALPEVVQAVQGCRTLHRPIPVFLDGGIRRGTDILKALALGASAVGIGKPVFFALGTGGGSQAVYDMLCMLHNELEAAMALTGCESIQDIGHGRPADFIRSAL
jgi:isopentenyl diphosphate isomerase/L-lactate dehydrogenase-like FMN-dependent dehydrogenase